MRILLPYNVGNGGRKFFDKNIITGGIEKFCYSIYETYSDVEVLDIENPKDFKTNTKLIQTKACEINADIIICNWSSASFVGAKIVKSPVPILHICHANVPLGSSIGTFHRLNNNYHTSYLMSSYQKRHFDDLATRLNCEHIPIAGFLNSGYVKGKKPKLVEPEYEIGTVGRCDPRDKKPFLLKTLLKKTDIKNLVISGTINSEHYAYPYFLRNQKWDGVKWDLEYKDVLKTMSKFKTHFLTHHHETWSITALESLSHGVPVIANTKNGIHAANTVVAKDEHIKNIEYNNKDQLQSAIKSFDGIDRKEIQDMTWELHTYKKWEKDLSNAVDRTIEIFKKRPKVTNGT